ncbi:MAG TPA: DUF1294 domain-containing protein [Allosphingosinicella sp.]|jgi:uncharacterized membrane protein YsdA (DUF1294 family)
MTLPPLPLVLAALVAVNLWTLWLFWIDKQRARSGEWRVPEENLLVLSAIGGTPGAFLARRLFRHKTRKQPFSTYLMLIAALQAGGAIGLLLF